ncbi:MAG: hypothetical protein OCC49_13865 [Fibrobacterales bacterium]
MFKLKCFVSIPIVLSLALTSCSLSDEGTTSGITDIETGGKFAGVLHSPSGELEPNAQVSLIPANYNPIVDSFEIQRTTTETDELGYYEFSDVDSGTYAIEIRNKSYTIGHYRSNIIMTSDSLISFVDTLLPTSTVTIKIPLHKLETEGRLYILNTTFSSGVTVMNDSLGTVEFTSIPPGVYPIPKYYSSTKSFDVTIGIDEMTISPDENIILEYKESSSQSLSLSSIESSSSEVASQTSSSVIATPLSSSDNSSSSVVSSSEEQSSSSIALVSSSELVMESSNYYLDTTEIIHLNGGNEFIDINTDFEYDWMSYGLTFELWVKFDLIEDNTHMIHLSRGSDYEYMISLGVTLDNTVGSLTYSVCNESFCNINSEMQQEKLDSVIHIGLWTQVAVTLTPTGTLSMYVNGVLEKEVQEDISLIPTVTSRSHNFLGTNSKITEGRVLGEMDNIRIWNRALSSEELLNNLYSTTDHLSDTDKLVASYDFNYNPIYAHRVTDASGNDHHADLMFMNGMYGVNTSNWQEQVDLRP